MKNFSFFLQIDENFLMGIIVAAITAPFDGAIFVMGCEYLNSLGPAELYAAIEN